MCALLGLTNPCRGPASAQDAEPPLRHLHHTAWRFGDDIPVGSGVRLVRSSDGYLWLGSPTGLVRFDGVRFVLFDGRSTPALRTVVDRYHRYDPCVVDRDGRMWIARPDGALVTYADGTFQVVTPGGAGAAGISDVILDRAGRMWAIADPTDSRTIVRIVRDRIVPAGLPTGTPSHDVISIVRDTGDGIWIGTHVNGLWDVTPHGARRVLPPRAPRARFAEQFVRPLLQTRDGTLWVSSRSAGAYRVRGDAWTPVLVGTDSVPPLVGSAAEARDGSVYLASRTHGLLRWFAGRLEERGATGGLSSNVASALLLDGEDDLWVRTDLGIDRLRRAAFTTLGREDGMPIDVPESVVEDASGALWISGGPDGGVYRLDGGVVRNASGPISARRAALPRGTSVTLLARAPDDGIWVGPKQGGLMRLDAKGLVHAVHVLGLPATWIESAVQTTDGTLWLHPFPAGLGAVRDGRYVPLRVPAVGDAQAWDLAADVPARALVVTSDRAPLATALVGEDTPRRLDARVALRLPIARAAVHGDTVWGLLKGGTGIARITAGRATDITIHDARSVLADPTPSLAVAGHELWFGSPSGVGSFRLAALDSAAEHHLTGLAPRLVTSVDGFGTAKLVGASWAAMLRARDGRLWLCTPAGLVVGDPSRPPVNAVPPNVRVEEITVGDSTVLPRDMLRIPANPDRVAIHYTATSLRLPERVRLQYRLDGVDRGWVEGGVSRVAAYSQLHPGRYRFRVRAWNEDGVASVRDATLAFRVLPAWYQTWWAGLLGGAVIATTGAAGTWAVARARQRRAERELRATMTERARVARELHDTLLGSLTGVALQLDAATTRAAGQAGIDATALAFVRDQAYDALANARRSVTELRAPESDGPLLPALIDAAAQRIFSGTGVDVRVQCVGIPWRFEPAVETEVLRIVVEAMTNAFKHAACRYMVATCTFDGRRLRIRVRDDGRGFDSGRMAPAGHWGLVGMRERAAAIGARFAVESSPDGGTDVMLTVRRD